MNAKGLAIQQEKEQHMEGKKAETRSNSIHHE
jgi:hypothetical protein